MIQQLVVMKYISHENYKSWNIVSVDNLIQRIHSPHHIDINQFDNHIDHDHYTHHSYEYSHHGAIIALIAHKTITPGILITSTILMTIVRTLGGTEGSKMSDDDEKKKRQRQRKG